MTRANVVGRFALTLMVTPFASGVSIAVNDVTVSSFAVPTMFWSNSARAIGSMVASDALAVLISLAAKIVAASVAAVSFVFAELRRPMSMAQATNMMMPIKVSPKMMATEPR